MTIITVLGSSNAIPDQAHDHTHYLIEGDGTLVLLDCGINPLVKLTNLGKTVHQLTDIIITHFHPDHVSGLAPLLLDMWLLGRKEPVTIHALAETLKKIEIELDLFNWKHWEGFFPVNFHQLPEQGIGQVLMVADMELTSIKVCHMIPCVGIRIKSLKSNKVMAITSDSEPCDQVVQLAMKADYLFHEASGEGIGHSSASQAGETASRADVKNLYLIHYPTGIFLNNELVDRAAARFKGVVKLAEDNLTIEF